VKVLATSALHPDAASRIEAAATLRVAADASPQTLVREARDADIIIVRDPIPAGVFGVGHHLRAVIRHGAGVDIIPVREATEAGVIVANVPGVNAVTVAEHVVMVTLALARHLCDQGDLRALRWPQARSAAVTSIELRGRTVGIIGTGQVARAVARILGAGFGMAVLGHSVSGRQMPEGMRESPLTKLLGASDVIVLACPLNSATQGLIGKRRLDEVRSGALLVNVSRGAVVDDEALAAALRGGRIGGAALDVFTNEPLPTDNLYHQLPNVLLTPHVAGVTADSMRSMGIGAAEAALRIISGQVPESVVNPEVISGHNPAATANC
jgi:D-3-phosphoglycerate dehydrogenase